MSLFPWLTALAALIVGQPGQISHVPGPVLTGAPDELYAMRVRAAGDVNGDGFGDVLVKGDTSAPDVHNGVVRLHSGFDGAVLHSFTGLGNHPFDGLPMAGVGDVDGDGHADLLIGNGADHLATLYSGLTLTELFTFHGDVADDGFGASVAAAGDVNLDGTPDVLVGMADILIAGQSRTVSAFSGADGSLLFTLEEESPNDAFGSAMSGVGDVNGDGHEDIAIGAYGDGIDVLNPGAPPFVPPFWTEDRSGAVSVYSGADGAPLWTVYGSLEYDGLGWSLAGLGDVNADGVPDVAAGTRSGDQVNPGYARILSGADGATLQTISAGDFSSFLSASAAGDLDEDGVPDLLVSHYGGSFMLENVRAFSGLDGAPIFAFDAPASFGPPAVAGLGDVNGDGLADFVVGIPQNHYGGGYAQIFASQGVVAESIAYGCGINPPDSLAVVSGTPALGHQLTLALDDPTGGTVGPAIAFLLVATQPDPAYPCGTHKPAWGLGGQGSGGELLVGITPPNPLLVLNVGTWSGAALPLPITVPSVSGLVGANIYLQGALIDTAHHIGLTSALHLVIGVP